MRLPHLPGYVTWRFARCTCGSAFPRGLPGWLHCTVACPFTFDYVTTPLPPAFGLILPVPRCHTFGYLPFPITVHTTRSFPCGAFYCYVTLDYTCLHVTRCATLPSGLRLHAALPRYAPHTARSYRFNGWFVHGGYAATPQVLRYTVTTPATADTTRCRSTCLTTLPRQPLLRLRCMRLALPTLGYHEKQHARLHTVAVLYRTRGSTRTVPYTHYPRCGWCSFILPHEHTTVGRTPLVTPHAHTRAFATRRSYRRALHTTYVWFSRFAFTRHRGWVTTYLPFTCHDRRITHT